jgi:hypothetical protein
VEHLVGLASHELGLGPEEVLLLGEVLLVEDLEVVAGNLLADGNVEPVVLASPQVLDELAIASRLGLGETVGLSALELLYVIGEIVANVGTEATLVRGLARAVVLELVALRVGAALLRAGLPSIKDFKGLGVVLGNDEASVEVDLAEFILVVLVGRVGSKGKRVGVLMKVPPVHHPLEGKVKVVEDGVGVEVQADLVVLEDFSHDRGLLP